MGAVSLFYFVGFEIPNKWEGYTINFSSEIVRYFKYRTIINQFRE